MDVFFDVTETLGSVTVDTSGRIAGLNTYLYVPKILDRLSTKTGFALGAILKNDRGFAPDYASVLEQSGVLRYFSPDLLIDTSKAGFGKDSIEAFEATLAHAQSLGKAKAKDSIFVGGNRGDRATAAVIGMKVAPHLLLTEAVAAGEYPIYLRIVGDIDRSPDPLMQPVEHLPIIPLHRANYDGKTEIIALSTEGMMQSLLADFDVDVLSDKVDAVREDLYLFLDAGGLDQEKDFVAELTTRQIKPVRSVKDGLLIALPPHQNIDAFHHGAGHGHNLKLLPDVSSPMHAEIAEQEFSTKLSESERKIITSVITEKRMDETLHFVTGTSPQRPTPLVPTEAPGSVGSNRHVLSPQMPAVTRKLMKKLDEIGGGAFRVTGHRFEITGACIKDVQGVPVAKRIELDNVIAEIPGDSDECILVTAHLDSTAAMTYKDRYNPEIHDAPGMDDDGSGVAAVLLIAEVLKEHFSDRKPPRTIRFVLFNAEEQGRIGSQRYAILQAQTSTDIVAVFQLDMIAYNLNPPNSFETHAGTARPDWCHYEPRVEKASLALSKLIKEISESDTLGYLTPAQIYQTPDGAAGRSDHSSFHLRGYPACLTCEDFFPLPGVEEANPRYHMADDQQANLPYATAIARVVCGAVLRVCDTADS